MSLWSGFLQVLSEVVLALLPLVGLFIVFELFIIKLEKEKLKQLLGGVVIAAIGLGIFLQGVYRGILPTGEKVGFALGQIDGMYQSEQLTGTSPATMPSRAVFGCQLSYPIGEGKLTLRVDNLTDEKYEEQAGYQMAPRNFTLSFKQAF
jgi:hypothetical protein